MDSNQYYNQLAQGATSSTVDRQGIAQGMKTAKQKSVESLAEGFGAGFILPSSANLLKYSGKKALQISAKALPETTRTITSLTEGTEGMEPTDVAKTVLSRATQLGRQQVTRGITSAQIKYTKLKDGITRTAKEYRTKNIPTRSNIQTKATAQLDDPFKVKQSVLDPDLRDDFMNGKISNTDMRIKQQMRNIAKGGDGVNPNNKNAIPARPTPDEAQTPTKLQQDALDRAAKGDYSTQAQLDKTLLQTNKEDVNKRFNKLNSKDQAEARSRMAKLDVDEDVNYTGQQAILDDIESRSAVRPVASLTADSVAVNTGTQAQHAQFSDRLKSLGMSGDNTDLNAPIKANDLGTSGNTLNAPVGGGEPLTNPLGDVEGDANNLAKNTLKKVGGGAMEDLGDMAGGAAVAEGGLDPVADIIGLVAGLGTLFGGLSSADDVKMPYVAPSINPSYQVGV